MSTKRTAWVLGAGFSRALGGPLIGDLLRFREGAVLQAQFPEVGYPGVAAQTLKARAFFAYGLEQGYWEHAEQFLDVVETAMAGGTGAGTADGGSLIESLLKGAVRFPMRVLDSGGNIPPTWREAPGPLHDFERIDDLAAAAQRAVAADCSLFLRAADARSERWEPYTSWAAKLDGSHTVITFNYDRVLEVLGRHGGRLHVIAPDADPDRQKAIIGAARSSKAPVLKLHGSVSWVRDNDGVFYEDEERDLALTHPKPKQLILGVPGPGKRGVAKLLSSLWDEALKAIGTADEVILVGYRFPPSDSDSRRRLLGAIADRIPGRPRVVRTVLGPNLHDPDASRLKALLTAAVPTAEVIPVPLYAEDFLSLWSPG